MTDQELDKLFKSKLDGNPPPFNPDNWAAMEQMLDSEARGLKVFWWQSAAIIALGLLLALPLFVDKPASNRAPAPTNIAAPSSPQEVPGAQPIDTQKANKTQKTTTPPALNSRAGASERGPAGAAEQNQKTAEQKVAQPAPSGRLTSPKAQNNWVAEEDASKNTRSMSPAVFSPDDHGLQPLTMRLPEQSIRIPGLSFDRGRDLVRSDRRHEFYLEAGPSINPAYNGQSSAGWSLGFSYRYRLNSRLSINSGLSFQRSGDFGLKARHDSVFFGLGRTEVNTQRQFREINLLRVPLSFELMLSPRHSAQMGIYADYLLSVREDLQRTTTVFKQDPHTENHSSQAQPNEFHSLNFGLRIRYFYRISPKLYLGLGLDHGLMDLTDDQHENFGQHHQLIQSSLMLRYRL